MTIHIKFKWLLLFLWFGIHVPGFSRQTSLGKKSAYLFVYFTGNGKGEEAIRYALSADGLNYRALNRNQPIIDAQKISSTGGLRDPHILRANDHKTFYMVATDMQVAKNGWGPNYAMVMMKSRDLINWTSHVVNIPETFRAMANVNRVWAPQSIYNPSNGKYMIYWSMRFNKEPDKIYYAYANKDFTGLETRPEQLYFSPDSAACIDGDIVYKDGRYHLFFKTEGRHPGIKKAVSSQLTGGYKLINDQYLQKTTDAVEGAGTFQLIGSNDWILMYDVYMKGKYQFTKTSDLENFTLIDKEISMDFQPRHGTIIPITTQEADALVNKWPTAKKHNPILAGLYADPYIMYSKKTGKFYIYPTSDGFTGWSGTYFKAFSSSDLSNWKDEGVILDLPKNVSWANKNAWAPCIIEKEINGHFKYFYYFTAAQKIGVAVADDPTGPFVDSGKPLINAFPKGITRGQQIDPDVFRDPKTGKTYLYWGNGYMAGAELNADMVSIDTASIKILTPKASYNEGTHVFYRKGTYYFTWSENDTRSEDYQVHYGTADSPLGPIKTTQNNLVIAKDKEKGIFGTGHHSVIQIPGKDEWYIVYHRFSYPNGITLGRAAGYNREVCIDKLEFYPDGHIKQTIPTHKGIDPVTFTRSVNKQR